MKNYPKVSADPRIQAEYETMRKAGQSHSIAEILASQTCPGHQTDKRFMQGRPQNEYYSRQLQRYVGSRADVKRVCEEQGIGAEGSVTVRPSNDNPRPDEVPYAVDPHLVKNYVQDVLDEHPTALKDDPELPQKVKNRLEGTE